DKLVTGVQTCALPISAPHDTRQDDRCKIDTMAPIAARYVKDLIAMFGTGPLSVPLAIASYNEGEGGLSTNLANALKAAMAKSDRSEERRVGKERRERR